MPTPPWTRRVEQINFGLVTRTIIHKCNSFFAFLIAPYVPRSLLFSPQSIDHLAREKKLAIIVIYVFITNHFGTTRLHCFQLLTHNMRPVAVCFQFWNLFGQDALLHDASIVGHSPNSCCDNYHELSFVLCLIWTFLLSLEFCEVFVNFDHDWSSIHYYIHNCYSEKEKARS